MCFLHTLFLQPARKIFFPKENFCLLHASQGRRNTCLQCSRDFTSFCSCCHRARPYYFDRIKWTQEFLLKSRLPSKRDNDRHSFLVIFTQLPALRDTQLPGFRKEQPLHAGNELDLPGGAALHNLGGLKHWPAQDAHSWLLNINPGSCFPGRVPQMSRSVCQCLVQKHIQQHLKLS